MSSLCKGSQSSRVPCSHQSHCSSSSTSSSLTAAQLATAKIRPQTHKSKTITACNLLQFHKWPSQQLLLSSPQQTAAYQNAYVYGRGPSPTHRPWITSSINLGLNWTIVLRLDISCNISLLETICSFSIATSFSLFCSILEKFSPSLSLISYCTYTVLNNNPLKHSRGSGLKEQRLILAQPVHLTLPTYSCLHILHRLAEHQKLLIPLLLLLCVGNKINCRQDDFAENISEAPIKGTGESQASSAASLAKGTGRRRLSWKESGMHEQDELKKTQQQQKSPGSREVVQWKQCLRLLLKKIIATSSS